MKAKHYKHIIAAGTFDRLHRGHTVLLNYACRISEKVSIALTTDTFPFEKILKQYIEPYTIRKSALKQYLKEKNLLARALIRPIHDFYGFALDDTSVDGILVTTETYKNAVKINDARRKLKMSKLAIISMPFVKGTDHRIIRSERIRAGETDRTGEQYARIFAKKQPLLLPRNMREIMRQPLGVIFSHETKAIGYIKKINPSMVITVGDVITRSFQEKGYTPDISIIDFKTRRKKLTTRTSKRSHINRPGMIHGKAVLAFKKQVQHFITDHKQSSLFIKGEEDLLALPAILLAPLGAVVLYGQYDLGIVLTQVTEDKKEVIKDMLSRFE